MATWRMLRSLATMARRSALALVSLRVTAPSRPRRASGVVSPVLRTRKRRRVAPVVAQAWESLRRGVMVRGPARDVCALPLLLFVSLPAVVAGLGVAEDGDEVDGQSPLLLGTVWFVSLACRCCRALLVMMRVVVVVLVLLLLLLLLLLFLCRVPPRRIGRPSRPSERKTGGEMFEGELVAGAPHGHGTYVFASGFMYEGTWCKGLPHGWGVLCDARWACTRYPGVWWRDSDRRVHSVCCAPSCIQ
jgi:hypothetical protein